MQSEVDTILEENTRLLYQANIMQKDNSDITGDISNIVVNHAHAEGGVLNLNTNYSEKN